MRVFMRVNGVAVVEGREEDQAAGDGWMIMWIINDGAL